MKNSGRIGAPTPPALPADLTNRPADRRRRRRDHVVHLCGRTYLLLPAPDGHGCITVAVSAETLNAIEEAVTSDG